MSEIDPGLIAEEVEERADLDDTGNGHTVGRVMLRKEDARLVTGQTTWTDNMQLPGMLYMAVLRSPDGARAHHARRRVRGAGAVRRDRGLHRRGPAGASTARCRAPGRSRRT